MPGIQSVVVVLVLGIQSVAVVPGIQSVVVLAVVPGIQCGAGNAMYTAIYGYQSCMYV